MSGEPGINIHLACPDCHYCLGGHDACHGVRCPECGGVWRSAQLDAAAHPVARFRLWMIPVFFLPAAGLSMLDAIARIGWRDLAVIPPAMFVVLFAMAYFALRDHRGIERLGTAIVLGEFLWLTSALLARFLPWLPI